MSDIRQKLDEIRARIDAAAKRSGRTPSEVNLIAVSKVHPSSAIRQAYEAGQRHFGENYVQELKEKNVALADLPDITWHFIGHLQRNKIKDVLPSKAVIQTVDSIRLIEALERQAAAKETSLSILIQVNVGDEAQKSGIDPTMLPTLLEAIDRSDRITAAGLMAIPPWDLETEETRKHFAALRRLRDRHGGAERLPHLSMGMSHDFEVAIEEGATQVRVGTAIFGMRPVKR